MKLLVVTQIVDEQDADLGFFHEWLRVLAGELESVIVICLKEGTHHLPPNVTVVSLGKESGVSWLKYILNFYRYCLRYRGNYDHVFVHMNPEYVILGAGLWRWWGKTVALWYVHKAVNLRLRIAARLATIIFTASRESFRLKSTKVRVVGHGISVDMIPLRESSYDPYTLRLVSVSRLAAVKGIDAILQAYSELQQAHPTWHMTLDIVGVPITVQDRAYEKSLHALAERLHIEDTVRWVGGLSHRDVIARYRTADVLVHASRTGSLDKVILEAMAAGLVVVSGSNALPDCPGSTYRFNADVPGDLAQSIEKIMHDGILQAPSDAGRVYVKKYHHLPNLIRTIIDSFLESAEKPKNL